MAASTATAETVDAAGEVRQYPPRFEPKIIPHVEIGDIVYWYPDITSLTQPAPAVVTGTGGAGRLCVAVLPRGYASTLSRDGVLHVDDPRARIADHDEGVWSVKPEPTPPPEPLSWDVKGREVKFEAMKIAVKKRNLKAPPPLKE